MKLYIIAGEASGDLHGSNLIKALREQDQTLEIAGWGGDLMQKAGMDLRKHYRDLAFMGFLEVLANLSTIRKNFAYCKEDISKYQPDAVILIDYPGFNLRMAKWIQEQGIKVLYYISPQLWAWNQSRVKKIRKYVDRMFVILPFEKPFYETHGLDVDFVGHPLIDAIQQEDQEAVKTEFLQKHGLDNEKIIAIIPGSRKQEISRMLPIMLNASKEFQNFKIVVAGAPSIPEEFYQSFNGIENALLVQNETYPLLSSAHAAMVTSGTATLETALFKVPEVVCYQGNYLSYLLARMLIKVKFISLVNLIMDKEVVKELIQKDFNEKSLKNELKKIAEDGEPRKAMLKNMDLLAEKLGGQGASKSAASLMIQYLSS